MRPSTIIFSLLPALALSSALPNPSPQNPGILENDIPEACKTICRPLTQLSQACQVGSTDSKAGANCICKNTSFDVKQLGSLCTICLTQTNALTDNIKSISSECGFVNTAYNQASASSLAATILVTATKAGSTQVVTGSASPSNTALGASSSTSKAIAPAQTIAMGIMVAALAAPIFQM
ncbi:hypothetical protein EJ08DRAFT_431443 [Tothia fuscella]|uniref:Extracellular membrane protein CFEM domain-containing protein n=1 Tax=Tothia fuscella TaxID=1048955 RepID=A0A9P4NYK7_9PEZI|nr:hypothetical protein EJ08DRAFT_431443 [Tothia fuscella]